MEPKDLTVSVLREIRDEILGVREDLRESRAQTHDELAAFRREAATRFEVIETTLRDLAEQMVMLGRGVKIAIEGRDTTTTRMEELERRVGELERRVG